MINLQSNDEKNNSMYDCSDLNKNLKSLNGQVENAVAKKLVIIIILCSLFMASEIVGGVLANSLAIICDGFHLLSDLGGFIISLFSTYLATRNATKRMNFGYRRIEILGAFSSIIIIWLLTGALLYMAVTRIINSDYEIDSKIMTSMAGIGVFFNIIMAFVLSYSHKPKQTKINKRGSSFIPPKIIDSKASFNAERLSNEKLKTLNDTKNQIDDTEKINSLVSRNINIRAAFIHIIGDLIQSLGVLIASLIIFFKPSYKIADPICTILFSIVVLSTTLPIMTDIINVLNESFPKKIDHEDLFKKILNIQGIKGVNDSKVWCLSTDIFALNASVLIDPKLINNYQLDTRVLQNLIIECKKVLLEEYNFGHINIQIEFDQMIQTSISKESIQIGNF